MSKRSRRHKKTERNYQRNQSTHHLLFQRRFWNTGYAHTLREDPYFKVEVPNEFHKELHERLHNIHTPTSKDCYKAYRSLIMLFTSGLITLNDSPEDRLQFLINEWAGICPVTVEELKWQQAIFKELADEKAWEEGRKGGQNDV